jgi:hypothetical protein
VTYILRRLFFILLGYGLSSISSGFVVALVMMITQMYFPDASRDPGRQSLLENFYLATILISLLAAGPALIVISIGEWWAIRRKRYYAIAGVLIGLGLSLLFYLMDWFPYVGAGYGSVAGLIYWFVAGRHAGFLTPDEKAAHRVQQIALMIFFGAGTIVLFAIYFGAPFL